MQCRAHVAQLGRLYEQIRASGTDVIVILGDSLERAKEYATQTKAPFPVLSDPERVVYHQYELEMQFIFFQRTASLVIDRQGIVRYIKRTVNTLEWPKESRELLSFVESMPDPS